jgi:Domain of unknown function (DUF1707)
MGTDRRIRASDQDRESTAELLSEAYAVRRLSREELGERAAAAYSAKTREELHALTADLPVRAARTGLPSGIVAVRRVPRRASGRPSDIAIWNLLLVLAAGLIGLVSPVAVWVAAVLVPIPLLLPAALGISRQCSTRAGTRAGGRQIRSPMLAVRSIHVRPQQRSLSSDCRLRSVVTLRVWSYAGR